MTENDRLRSYLQNPPPGSAARRAMGFGIDLSLTYRNMFEHMFELTMAQRWAKLDEHIAARQQRVAPRPVGKIPQ